MKSLYIFCAIALGEAFVTSDYKAAQGDLPEKPPVVRRLTTNRFQEPSLLDRSPFGILRKDPDLNCAQKVDSILQQLKSLQTASEVLEKALVFGRGASCGEKIYVTNDLEVTYKEAAQICSKAGGQLASPQNSEENNAVLALSLEKKKRPFLGINDIPIEGSFRYTDGQAIGYSNWYPGEPNNQYWDEDCVEMYHTGEWNDKNCKEKRLVICEFF